MEFNLGISGAKRTSYKLYNLRDLCLRVQAAHPKADMDQLRDLLIIEIKKDAGYIDTAVEYAATRTVANTFKNPEEEIIKQKITKEKTTAITAKTVSKLKEHIVKEANIMLLDLTMANGKALRNCTGAECVKFGGWFSAIAAKVGRKQLVGNALSEEQLRSLYKSK